MPFGIPKEGFWSVKELAYQHTHMFYGFWLGYIAFCIFPFMAVPALCGLFSGMLMELYQYRYYILALRIPSTLADSLRDLCFWIIGGCLNYIIIFAR